jgi:serine/threonine protein kinase
LFYFFDNTLILYVGIPYSIVQQTQSTLVDSGIFMMSFGLGTLACYDQFEQVGEGAYGYVYKARNKRSNESVALKR